MIGMRGSSLTRCTCRQVPVSPFDNALAVDQMEVAYSTLLARPVANESSLWAEKTRNLSLDGEPHPRIISYVCQIVLGQLLGPDRLTMS